MQADKASGDFQLPLEFLYLRLLGMNSGEGQGNKPFGYTSGHSICPEALKARSSKAQGEGCFAAETLGRNDKNISPARATQKNGWE
jgi:hypothetical protein